MKISLFKRSGLNFPSKMIKNLLSSKLVWLVLVVVAIVALWKLGLIPSFSGDKYQAVFLTNNQVYFGKLSRSGSNYPVLRDIYYLRVTQALQPKDPNTPAQQINLVKLGGELHGPEDEMRINKEQILFIEDLKADSQVVTAINDYKKAQAK